MDELTLNLKNSNENPLNDNNVNLNTNSPEKNNHRQYPKNREGATNHWAAVVSHIEEYDKGMHQKKLLDSKKDQVVLSNKLKEQIQLRRGMEEEKLQQEKALDRKLLDTAFEAKNKNESKRQEFYENRRYEIQEDFRNQMQRKKDDKHPSKSKVKGENCTDKFVKNLKETPFETGKRLNIEKENQEFALKRKELKNKDDDNGNFLEMSKGKKSSEPAEKRVIRKTMEDENRRKAIEQKVSQNKNIQNEKDIAKKFFDDDKKFYENPNMIRRKIRENFEIENNKQIEKKKEYRELLSKSVDYGAYNSPMQLLDEYYKIEDVRKQRVQSYVKDLKDDLDKVRAHRSDLITKEFQEDSN